MKNLIFLIPLLLCGCETRIIEIGNARYSSTHLFTAKTVGEIRYSNDGSNATITVKQWTSDVSAQLPVIVGSAVEGAVKGMK